MKEKNFFKTKNSIISTIHQVIFYKAQIFRLEEAEHVAVTGEGRNISRTTNEKLTGTNNSEDIGEDGSSVTTDESQFLMMVL
jgi:hypothetical protein